MITWDERLITRERAANMSGTWDLKMDYPYLRCNSCDGNVTMLPVAGKIINVDGIISAVVRHMAMNHGYSLSGSANGNASGETDHAGDSSGSGSAAYPVYRSGY